MRTPEYLKKTRTHAIIVTRGETRRTGKEFLFLARRVCSREVMIARIHLFARFTFPNENKGLLIVEYPQN